jgi:hypothetical protein
LRITWDEPKNCTGIEISREGSIIAKNAHGSFEDKGLSYNKLYSYILKANYSNLPSSNGIKFEYTPRIKINQFTISATLVKANKYKVIWNDIKRPDIDLRILADKKDIRRLKSGDNFCEIELPSDRVFTIEVVALSGDTWLSSKNSIEINTFLPCEIDKTVSLIEKPIAGKIELPIKILGNIPNNAKAFWYVVRIKASHDKFEPWANANEITNARDVIKVPVDSYKKNGTILYSDLAKETDTYYVTLFTIYSINGKEVISAPSKQSFARKLNANIIWKVSKPLLCSLFKRKVSIRFEVESNYPLMRVPKLILCASQKRIESYTNANVEILDEIPEERFSSPQRNYKKEKEFPSEKLSKIDRSWNLSLIEAEPIANEKFTFRWGKNFSGKI